MAASIAQRQAPAPAPASQAPDIAALGAGLGNAATASRTAPEGAADSAIDGLSGLFQGLLGGLLGGSGALPKAGESATQCFMYVVLARNATQAQVAPAAAQVQALATTWGMAFSPSMVRLADENGTDIVELRWSPAWGPMPVTRDIPASCAPIDAKMAVGAARASAGWAKLDATTQGQVSALLGGESNELSAAARSAFRAARVGWATMSAEDQAKALTDLLGSTAARPYVLSEPVDAAQAKYTLSGPTVKTGHAFRGITADANVHKEKFEDNQEIIIYSPKAPSATLHNHSVQQAADAAAKLPEASRKVVKTITLNAQVNPDDAYWATQYNNPNFHSYMTAGAAGDVTIYPDTTAPPSQDVMNGSMVHETGHTWSYQTWGQDTTKGGWVEWKKAMDSDKISVSNYATNAIAEDVAETIRAYGSSKGTPKHDEYRAMVPARFKILDAQLK